MHTQKLRPAGARLGRPPNQKKLPRQSRSKFTLDVILEAAEQLLRDGGVAAVTTRRVALRAGVGLSTLYDYFPNRDAIIIQLANRLMQRRQEEMAPELVASQEKSMPELFKAIAEYAVANDRILLQFGDGFHSRYARFFHCGAYDPQVNGAASKERLTGFESVLHSMLADHPAQVGEADVELAAFLLSRVIRNTINTVVEERPELVQSPSFTAVIERMMLAIVDCTLPEAATDRS
ncbi:TetR/AcrR family transcriptional regulator [Denitratisoma sp. DHT3]|uniref:TetR/AcrR family transcriptional regulator n=1 Tax=Denitratisoma sp. DHT3 TaxID=1981880 RepID=UPI0016488672|nr:TetR/AcrR family transcriptional regulator [Denitratisoma sp. DHT3]